MAVGQVEQAKIVIVETANDMAGVIVDEVDEVDEVLTVEAEQLDDAPVGGGDVIEAIAKIDDRPIILLNLAGLFGAELPVTA